jgi:hypothetical protein
MKVFWDGPGLEVSEGDEVEIISGIRGEDHVRASVIRNRTRGTMFNIQTDLSIFGGTVQSISPPLRGFARSILVHSQGTFFLLEEKAPPIIPAIFQASTKFLDPKLVERCRDKGYNDVLTNALSVLEEAIRARLGVDSSYAGQQLIDYAFHPTGGKLMLGETENERQLLYLVFKGLVNFLGNPQKSSSPEESDERSIEAYEITCMTDLLMRIIGKAQPRTVEEHR